MYYEKKENSEIRIFDTQDFEIEHVLDCGQVFRYRKDGDCHTLLTKDKICLLQKTNDCVIIKTDDTDYFEKYFDLNRNYGEIKNHLARHDGLSDALKYGYGIRILNQDPYEMIISFIISANNNIPRIKGIIEKICCNLGEKKDGYYAFPTLERLCEADVEFFRKIGAGYRAEYLVKTAQALQRIDVNKIYSLDTRSARKALTELMGVGNKVANCILLFAYHKTDLFPMDTWSKKIYRQLNLPSTDNVKKMEDNLVAKFGELSGYAQQYLFYYYRTKK